jgi:hypothetical protein
LAEPKAPWRVTYSDGSGNALYFWCEEAGTPSLFRYDPVRPEFSSSGIYSGGEPKTGDVPDANLLWRRLAALEAAKSAHLDHRPKGSGQVTITGPPERSFVVGSGDLLRAFEVYIAQFHG